MGRFLLLIGLLVGALLLTNGTKLLTPGSVGTRVEGREVVSEMWDFEVRYTKADPVHDSYMIFGGDAKQRRNQFGHATVAALPIADARQIASRFPDFHRCKSPGARVAMDLIEQHAFIAADRSTRSALVEAVELHEERLYGDGQRTCFTVIGARLEPDSVTDAVSELIRRFDQR